MRAYSSILAAVITALTVLSLPALLPAAQSMIPLAETVERIVIDPGHGGDDEGVKGPTGLTESRLTLALARQLKIKLEDELGVRVFLTRQEGENPSLSERTALANRVRAHLFISLHAGEAFARSRFGFGVFFQDYSLQEGLADQVSLSRPDPGKTAEWPLAQAPFVLSSRRLAGEINQAIIDVLRIKSQEVVGLPLAILAGAARPAVLIEVGYLSNPQEERRLLSQAYRDAVTKALVKGLNAYQQWVKSRLGE